MYLNSIGSCGAARNGTVQNKRPKNSTFGEQLSEAGTRPSSYVIPLKGEGYIYYIGHGDGQDVYVEYAEGSPPDDPMVRIRGHALSGEFDFVRRIREIDPRNASYAELCALAGYQNHIGAYPGTAVSGFVRPVPLGMQTGDFLAKADYMDICTQYLSSGIFSSSIYRQGIELLDFYKYLLSAAEKPSEKSI